MGNKKGIITGSAQRTYDSDEDLSKEYQKKIEDAYRSDTKEKLRKEGWEKADVFSKIKKAIKSGVYGDKRKPK